MNQADSIISRIRSFVLKTFPAARKRGISDESLLLESGIVDSLGVLEVVAFLEKSFVIQLSDEELTPENFANIKRIAVFVERKQSQNSIPAQ